MKDSEAYWFIHKTCNGNLQRKYEITTVYELPESFDADLAKLVTKHMKEKIKELKK